MNGVRVGDVRPSQLLWTYGPGALIDLPNMSVVTMGLNRWEFNRCRPIDEARLLDAVRRILGPQVRQLMMPPIVMEERVDPFSAEGRVGVPVRPFPRWLRCVRCGLLADYDSGLFKCKENLYRPDATRFVHVNCEKGGESDAVPARFLLACRSGHMDDFPWHWFVHGGPSSCKGTLRFFERGASLQTENLWVKCDAKDCGAARSLVHAFGQEAAANLPACRGRNPHLDRYDSDCTEQARAVLLGATNSWFPITLSALAIPLTRNPLSQLMNDAWEVFGDTESEAELKGLVKGLVRRNEMPQLASYSIAELWEEIERRRSGANDTAEVSDGDIKGPEWDVLTHSNPPTNWPHFLSRRVERPAGFEKVIQGVLLLERLREVNALIGFTRVEAPEEAADAEERPPMAPLTTGSPTWVPANEVHGEGIFIRFQEDAVKKWQNKIGVKSRDRKLLDGHRGWRTARRLDAGIGYPGIRYALLHTVAHILIRELALECGYNAASIRERIYATSGDGRQMAGILLYTAAADSDGTLGGLVELGKPENLGRLLTQALERARICSSDPLCSEHDPSEDRSLHAASCHACGFVAETSCERGNRYLDRSLLVTTMDCRDAAFFEMDIG